MRLHHRAENLERTAGGHRPRPVRRVSDRFVFRPFPRRVRRRVLQAEEERLRVLAPDDLDRLVAQQVCQVADAFDGREVLPEISSAALGGTTCVHVSRAMREVVDGAAQHTEELVEPVTVWSELRPPAEMPFADE